MTTDGTISGSFRDPSGFLFTTPDGVLYRQVNRHCARDFEAFHDSGLYDELAGAGLLIPHERADDSLARTDEAVAVIRPETVPVVSYPYEWCFQQLKDAALLTLDIQNRALARNMSLKDASAFNVMFRGSRPVFIDTLSFERLREGEPWIAYKQFCQHFLAPLALMAFLDPELNSLLRTHVDGVSLPAAARMLPGRTRLSPGLMMHIHAHAKVIDHVDTAPGHSAGGKKASRSMSLQALRGIVASLQTAVRKLSPGKANSLWYGYAEAAPYSEEAESAKRSTVDAFLESLSPDSVWDLGANTGVYSEIARNHAPVVVAMEQDHACVNDAYLRWKNAGTDILALRIDLTNPSPALGWAHTERESLADRGPADVVLALALVHHICISNNVPLERFAAYLARLGRHAIVEFVDKSDPMVQHLLSTREDIFESYTPQGFEAAFAQYFHLREKRDCGDARRTVYWFTQQP